MGKEVNFGKLLHGGDYNPEQWLDRPDILAKDVELNSGWITRRFWNRIWRISRKPESTRFRLACFPGHF